MTFPGWRHHRKLSESIWPGDLAAALSRLRAVHASYWDHDWRREHRGFGHYPEHYLWEAVQGYLDLYDAAESAD